VQLGHLLGEEAEDLLDVPQGSDGRRSHYNLKRLNRLMSNSSSLRDGLRARAPGRGPN
jgi:hypothetical protein